MLGAIIGDIAGSRFEGRRRSIKTKEFTFMTSHCRATDDSIMTFAVAKALLACGKDYDKLNDMAVTYMQKFGRLYTHRGYGGMFGKWIHSDFPEPYNSFGNGAAMRVSACGLGGSTLEEVKMLSQKVTEVTHSHPEGLKGAEATAVCVFLARSGKNLLEIRDYVSAHYYPMDFTIDGIRDDYTFNVSCQGTVPQAIAALLESTGFEDAIRNAVSLGGDSDTLAAITGGMAGAYYGVPCDLREQALTFLDLELWEILKEFESAFPFAKVKTHENPNHTS